MYPLLVSRGSFLPSFTTATPGSTRISDFLSLSKGNVFIVFASEVHLILRSGELVVWPQFCVMLVIKYGLDLLCFFCAQGNLNERMIFMVL